MENGFPNVPVDRLVLPRCSFSFQSQSSSEPVLSTKNYSKSSPPRVICSTNEKCLSGLQTFADETTVHGIWNITRTDKPMIIRMMWSIAFLACFFSCIYFVGSSTYRYFSFEVITTESLGTEHEIEFPAITICNENLGKKSILGSSDNFIKTYTAFIVNKPEQYEQKLSQVMATCKHEMNNNINLSKFLNENDYESWLVVGHAKLMHYLSTDSYYSVVKCWWKGDEQSNCSSTLFLNHMTDHGWCFTFNPHPNLVKTYSLGFEPNSSAYGLSDNYKMLKLVSAGPNNGLRLLLNAHYDDYCAGRQNSVGFKILIHDPLIQPLFFLDRPIFASPGFNTIVGIRLRRLIKLTQHLKKCTDYLPLYMYPNATIYFKEACYMQCFTEYVYKHCFCTPPFGPPRANYIVAKRTNLKYVSVCWNMTMLCMKRYEREFLDIGLEKECKWCLNPCDQLSYDFQVSQLYFPVGSWAKIYPDIASKTTEKFRENYAMVDFYVESMSMGVITETQAFTFDQLVADIGGQLGFLLGMSVLSLLEFIQLLIPTRMKSAVAHQRMNLVYDTKHNSQTY